MSSFSRGGCVLGYATIYGLYGNDEGLKKRGKEIHAAIHDEIRQMVPTGRLLEYRLAEGWDTLCNPWA